MVVYAEIGVFSAAVDLFEWFFVEEDSESMFIEYLLHDGSDKDVLVQSGACFSVYACDFELV